SLAASIMILTDCNPPRARPVIVMLQVGRKKISVLIACSTLLFDARLFASDLKVKQVVTIIDQNYEVPRSSQHEETTYVQGSRERMEYRVPDTADAHQPHTAEIVNCQALSGYHVDFNTRKYAEVKMPPFPSKDVAHLLHQRQEAWSKKRYAMQTIETGEKKMFFGFTASHIITSIHGITSRDRSEAIIDGWYIGQPQPGCAPAYPREAESLSIHASFLARVASNTVYTGFVPPGFAVEETITTRSRFEARGLHHEIVTVVKRKLTEMSQEPLDPALFKVPEGFERLDHLPVDVTLPRPALRQR